SVKYEEVYLKDYEVCRDAREGLGKYFSFYNNRRYHQSLEYKTPHEVHFGVFYGNIWKKDGEEWRKIAECAEG
ncbi:MAG: transposase, partial [Candidatus Brocadia sp.]|nr:transposase [Candidatus Brocadia sp.]